MECDYYNRIRKSHPAFRGPFPFQTSVSSHKPSSQSPTRNHRSSCPRADGPLRLAQMFLCFFKAEIHILRRPPKRQITFFPPHGCSVQGLSPESARYQAAKGKCTGFCLLDSALREVGLPRRTVAPAGHSAHTLQNPHGTSSHCPSEATPRSRSRGRGLVARTPTLNVACGLWTLGTSERPGNPRFGGSSESRQLPSGTAPQKPAKGRQA